MVLESGDFWDIVMGKELEPNELGWVVNGGEEGAAVAAVDVAKEVVRLLEIKDWKRRYKKAASVIIQSLDARLDCTPQGSHSYVGTTCNRLPHRHS